MPQVTVVVKKNGTNAETSPFIAQIEQMFTAKFPKKKPGRTKLSISGEMSDDEFMSMKDQFCENGDLGVIKSDFTGRVFEITVH